MAQRLEGWASCAIVEPRHLVADLRRAAFDAIVAITKLGDTILLVEQNAFMALEIARTACVLQIVV